MRLSCNGCRVLRKGCSDDCSIRPCLEWIQCPFSQANATVFLAKFYGRAGLMNLINAGPVDLRPAIFRSLLYEACGRIVNPICGSAGLLWSGNWQLCHNAVEAVLAGASITQITADPDETKNGPPLKAYDIRHINKDDNISKSNDVRRIKNRKRFKRSGPKSKRVTGSAERSGREEVNGSPSHESSLSHQSEAAAVVSLDCNSLASAENVEPALNSADGIELDLSLGLEPFKRCGKEPVDLKQAVGSAGDEAGFCRMKLGLD